ncbi:hypothetical protein LXL04_030248 [Taraxacum kok-saghyz]
MISLRRSIPQRDRLAQSLQKVMEEVYLYNRLHKDSQVDASKAINQVLSTSIQTTFVPFLKDFVSQIRRLSTNHCYCYELTTHPRAKSLTQASCGGHSDANKNYNFQSRHTHRNLLRTHIFPRTPKPLTFSKNRFREAKNRSNTSLVANFFFRKNDFFFSKTLYMCTKKKKKLHMCTSFYNTYLNGFVEKNLKKKLKKKKSCTYSKNKKKVVHMQKLKKKLFFRNFFFATGLIFYRCLAPRIGFFRKS